MEINADKIVTSARSIRSAITQLEGIEIVRYAERVPKNGLFVEIGSYLGCSSVILGSVAQIKESHFIMIEPFYETNQEECEKNLSDCGITRYQLVVGRSHDVADEIPDGIDVLFVDGSHLYPGMKQDCEDYIPKVKRGGIIMFHDYESSWLGVKKAVDEYANKEGNINHIRLVDSLLIVEKIDAKN